MQLVGKLSKYVRLQKLKEDIVMPDRPATFYFKKVDYESAKYMKMIFSDYFL